MFWRPITTADLPVIFSEHPAAFGSELIGEAAARDVWRDLLSWPGFNGAVIEKRMPGRPAERLGFGAGVFVAEKFAQQEINYPRPGLNGRMLAAFACRTGGVLGLREIAEDNASEGLNVLTLFGRPSRTANQQEAIEVRQELAAVFVELYAGYRFRRMLTDLKDHADVEYALATCVYNLIPHHPEAVPNGWTALGVISSESVSAVPGSILDRLFRAPRPELGLRVTDQELLRAALAGLPDTELASRLDIKLAAVKRRWEDIYRTVATSRLPIAAAFNAKCAEGKRGAQKRHILLEYLRQHREELRPFLRNARRSVAVR